MSHLLIASQGAHDINLGSWEPMLGVVVFNCHTLSHFLYTNVTKTTIFCIACLWAFHCTLERI